MRVLLLIAHADPTHSAAAFRIAKVAKETLEQNHHEVREVILNEEGFDKVLSMDDFKIKYTEKFDYLANNKPGNLIDIVQKQVDNVEWCDNVLVIGPMWFYRFPACFESWVERVLISAKGQGKKASMIISNEGDEEYYSERGVGTLEQLLYSTYRAFRYSKFDVNRPLGYYKAGFGSKADPVREKAWLEKLVPAIAQLDKWKPWGTDNNTPALGPENIVLGN